MSDLIALIKTVGFPATLVLLLGFLLEVRMKELMIRLKDLEIVSSKCLEISRLLVKSKLENSGGE